MRRLLLVAAGLIAFHRYHACAAEAGAGTFPGGRRQGDLSTNRALDWTLWRRAAVGPGQTGDLLGRPPGSARREVLDQFAKHCKTEEPMPQALVDKVRQSEKFNQGYATVEYLAAAIADMDLHTKFDGVAVADAAAFERDVLKRIGMPKEIALRHRLPTHILTDGNTIDREEAYRRFRRTLTSRRLSRSANSPRNAEC